MEKIVPDEYLNLFNAQTQESKKLISKSTLSFKLRNAISYLNYDEDYSIEVTKINVNSSLIFKKDIVEGHKKISGGFSGSEMSYHENNIFTNYRAISQDKASKIYLSLYGDSVRTVLKNDSVAYYYLKMEKAYVQYNLGGIYEIFAESDKKLFFFSKNRPVSLLFLKKRDSLYFLLLTTNDDNTKLDPDLLYKLVR